MCGCVLDLAGAPITRRDRGFVSMWCPGAAPEHIGSDGNTMLRRQRDLGQGPALEEDACSNLGEGGRQRDLAQGLCTS